MISCEQAFLSSLINKTIPSPTSPTIQDTQTTTLQKRYGVVTLLASIAYNLLFSIRIWFYKDWRLIEIHEPSANVTYFQYSSFHISLKVKYKNNIEWHTFALFDTQYTTCLSCALKSSLIWTQYTTMWFLHQLHLVFYFSYLSRPTWPVNRQMEDLTGKVTWDILLPTWV